MRTQIFLISSQNSFRISLRFFYKFKDYHNLSNIQKFFTFLQSFHRISSKFFGSALNIFKILLSIHSAFSQFLNNCRKKSLEFLDFPGLIKIFPCFRSNFSWWYLTIISSKYSRCNFLKISRNPFKIFIEILLNFIKIDTEFH